MVEAVLEPEGAVGRGTIRRRRAASTAKERAGSTPPGSRRSRQATPREQRPRPAVDLVVARRAGGRARRWRAQAVVRRRYEAHSPERRSASSNRASAAGHGATRQRPSPAGAIRRVARVARSGWTLEPADSGRAAHGHVAERDHGAPPGAAGGEPPASDGVRRLGDRPDEPADHLPAILRAARFAALPSL